MASSDIDSLSSVSLFPVEQDGVSVFAPDGLVADFQVPVPRVVIPSQDPMVQILQGFQPLFSKQDQDCLDDCVDRRRFENNIQYIVLS
jgi:hypothetical protein